MNLKIRELREERYLTQKQLGDKIGSAQKNVSNWENGVTEPDLASIVRLADFFEVTLDELFGRVPPQRAISRAEVKLFKKVTDLTDEQKKSLLGFLEKFST